MVELHWIVGSGVTGGLCGSCREDSYGGEGARDERSLMVELHGFTYGWWRSYRISYCEFLIVRLRIVRFIWKNIQLQRKESNYG